MMTVEKMSILILIDQRIAKQRLLFVTLDLGRESEVGRSIYDKITELMEIREQLEVLLNK